MDSLRSAAAGRVAIFNEPVMPMKVREVIQLLEKHGWKEM